MKSVLPSCSRAILDALGMCFLFLTACTPVATPALTVTASPTPSETPLPTETALSTSTSTLTPLPTNTLSVPGFSDSIDQAEHKWQAQGIRDYRIQVLYTQSIWHAETYSITVRNEQVVEQSAFCIPAPAEAGKCTVQAFNAEDYTVPGLFAIARNQVRTAEGKWTKITFDRVYGFPRQIAHDNPQIYDDDAAWTVKSLSTGR